MLKLSKPSKMPCKTWSLEARKTCPGSINPTTKQVIDACAICYATEGFYHMPDAKRVRDENRQDWKRADWVTDMIAAIGKAKYFRWFDSGDCYHPRLAEKIYEIMLATPNCKHWLPTKSYNIPSIRVWLDKMQSLSNVSVRFSSPSVTGRYDSEHGSTIVPFADTPTNASICDAYAREGKCGDCRNCWNKSIPVIAYPMHGRRAAKIQKSLR